VGDASRVAPIDKLSVVLVPLCATAFLGERPSPRDWFGIGLVGAGALLSSSASAPQSRSPGAGAKRFRALDLPV